MQVIRRCQARIVNLTHISDLHVKAVQLRHGGDLRLDLIAVQVRVAGCAGADAEQFAAGAEGTECFLHRLLLSFGPGCDACARWPGAAWRA